MFKSIIAILVANLLALSVVYVVLDLQSPSPTFDLVEYTLDGSVYVQDYSLTKEDCIDEALKANTSTNDSSYLCEVSEE